MALRALDELRSLPPAAAARVFGESTFPALTQLRLRLVYFGHGTRDVTALPTIAPLLARRDLALEVLELTGVQLADGDLGRVDAADLESPEDELLASRPSLAGLVLVLPDDFDLEVIAAAGIVCTSDRDEGKTLGGRARGARPRAP